jgi:two-component system alkaline phosphatase synthesis response regulator PhoP
MERTVLIIEDEKLIIVSTQMVLERLGYRVESAVNGEEGIGKASEPPTRPDPARHHDAGHRRLGDADAAQAGRPPHRSIPVIIFTAREHARGHQKSDEMGAADYFRKPFEPDELIELVEKHVGEKV